MAAGDAGHAMASEEAMIVAGIGCGSGVSSEDIVSLIHAALSGFSIAHENLGAIATETSKADENGITSAASPVRRGRSRFRFCAVRLRI